MARIAICDDDEIYLEKIKPRLAAALKNAGLGGEVSYFTDGNLILSDFERREPYDIVILDIDMPKINGKNLAEKLRVLDSSFFLVFITSYKSEVYNTIPYRINAFIPKDSADEYMVSELERVFEDYKKYKPEYEILSVISEQGKREIRIPTGDIFYFYCSNKTNYAVTGAEEYRLSDKRFSEIEKCYLNKGFFEICRGCMVNIRKVREVQSSAVILDSGASLPLSRGRKSGLLEEISKYVFSEVDNRDLANA